ncbi:hypothetical protein BLD48_10175 [Exiguobacterium sp. KRL4]|uniref:hypothetical protein n=1 Tax=Exiguobacterium sp. KRL4 TaxID=1914536 RepID=UPI0008F96213|nr:hypothetical protein [Exiguobacterium sp. KRL4]OIN66670.1 hypothetical protein BLD48_10175 [Exiguobacterium sp. KRL4]
MKMNKLKKFVSGLTVCSLLLVGNTAFADSAGWQYIASQRWTVDSDTTTTAVSMDGGGVKVCFSDVDYEYRVTLKEQDPANPDETYSSKTLGKGSSCLTWSEINSESGKEELYLNFSKVSKNPDSINVVWYD